MRRAALLLIVCACGLAPQDELGGRRIGDGIAPWQDLGGLPLCLGTHHVGAPASAVGGFCQPDTAPPQTACSSDGECASRERCVCGRCAVQYCSTASECGEGHICSFSEHRCDVACASGDDCARGESCLNGVCRAGCQDDSDCQAGEVCGTQGTSRRCIVAACADDTGCRAGEFCDVQREPRETDEPTVLAEDGRFTLWLEMSDRTPADHAIWRAVSQDGVSYRVEPAMPVFTAGGDAHAPSVVRDGAGYHLFFETTGGISSAESGDGIAFSPGSVVITGDWHAPGAVTADLVYVTGGTREDLALWSGGGAPAVVYTPADVTDPELWRDVQTVGSPFALIETSPLGVPTIHLWFDAFGTESRDSIQFGMRQPIPPNDSIGFASTPLSQPEALVSYPFNPVFDRVVGFLQHRGERAPAVVRVPGEEVYFLYYEGYSPDGTEHDGLGVARTPAK